jgi:hypothetical protein
VLNIIANLCSIKLYIKQASHFAFVSIMNTVGTCISRVPRAPTRGFCLQVLQLTSYMHVFQSLKFCGRISHHLKALQQDTKLVEDVELHGCLIDVTTGKRDCLNVSVIARSF